MGDRSAIEWTDGTGYVFQVLTKHDERMRELLCGSLLRTGDLQNVAYGVSVSLS